MSIFTDLDTGEVVFVTPRRKKEVFEAFRNWLLSLGLKAYHVQLFTMYMSKSYHAGREKYFPESKIVFDRFTH